MARTQNYINHRLFYVPIWGTINIKHWNETAIYIINEAYQGGCFYQITIGIISINKAFVISNNWIKIKWFIKNIKPCALYNSKNYNIKCKKQKYQFSY